MKIFWGYKLLEKLPKPKNLNFKYGLAKEIRAKCKIAFIDDNPQTIPIETYRANGYSVVLLGNINEITDHFLLSIKEYDVIACDLRGVGVVANPKLEGAHIISEIKKAFPTKIVVSYTGAAHKIIIENAKRNSDYFIQRAESPESWMRLLDEAIAKALNPHEFLREVSISLLKAGYPIKSALSFEDAIVTAYLKNTKADRVTLEKDIISELKKSDLDKHAIDMIKSFIPSAAVKLIFLGS